jgi:hypothetical protein
MPRCRHNPNLPHRSGFKPLMRRDLERRLPRAEISAPETSWGDRKAADRRQSLRTRDLPGRPDSLPAANRQVLIFGREVRLYSADRNLRTLPDHPDPSERR